MCTSLRWCWPEVLQYRSHRFITKRYKILNLFSKLFIKSNQDILIEKIAGDGFTQAFYMTNYCWDNMIDFPAKSQKINGTYIQVFDEDRKDEVTNLRSVSLTIFLIVLKSRKN